MQMPFVMMMALTGLGCQNKTGVVVDAVPLAPYQVESLPLAGDQGRGYSNSTYAGSLGPAPYPEIPSHIYDSPLQSSPADWHTGLRSTLYSFVFGRDPDVSTVREIEASVYGIDAVR